MRARIEVVPVSSSSGQRRASNIVKATSAGVSSLMGDTGFRVPGQQSVILTYSKQNGEQHDFFKG